MMTAADVAYVLVAFSLLWASSEALTWAYRKAHRAFLKWRVKPELQAAQRAKDREQLLWRRGW